MRLTLVTLLLFASLSFAQDGLVDSPDVPPDDPGIEECFGVSDCPTGGGGDPCLDKCDSDYAKALADCYKWRYVPYLLALCYSSANSAYTACLASCTNT